MNTLEQFMRNLKERHPKTEVVKKQISRAVVNDAVLSYLQPLYGGKDIKSVDILALTTELVDIKITKEV